VGNRADFRLDSGVQVDGRVLNKVLNAWYREIARRGGIPVPGTSLAISQELRADYTAGVADVLARAAARSAAPVAEFYRVNRGRIPPWAWRRPYQRVPGIATPVPERLRPAGRDGAVSFSVRGIAVTILTDAFDPAMRGRAETRATWSWQPPGYQYTVDPNGDDKAGIVTALSTVRPPALAIQTFYCRDVQPDGIAGYGRGSTREDIAGARVYPWSATVAFHEGQHGMDYFEFLREELVPRFQGRAGLTVTLFRAASEHYNKAWAEYQTRVHKFSQARTDHVGAARGRRPHIAL
jgi:hypothetical protein